MQAVWNAVQCDDFNSEHQLKSLGIGNQIRTCPCNDFNSEHKLKNLGIGNQTRTWCQMCPSGQWGCLTQQTLASVSLTSEWNFLALLFYCSLLSPVQKSHSGECYSLRLSLGSRGSNSSLENVQVLKIHLTNWETKSWVEAVSGVLSQSRPVSVLHGAGDDAKQLQNWLLDFQRGSRVNPDTEDKLIQLPQQTTWPAVPGKM